MTPRELNELRWARALEEVEMLERAFAYEAPQKHNWAGLAFLAFVSFCILSGLTIFALGVERLWGLIF